MHNTGICYGANNYNDILYIFSNSVINPHIDRIKFSCNSYSSSPEETLFSVLKDNDYRCVYGKRLKCGAYKRVRRYHSHEMGIYVSILYNRRPYCSFYPNISVIIDNPDVGTVDWFDAVCNSFGFSTTLSQVELTMDISPYECGLQEFFWKHLFLKYHGGEVRFFGGDVSKSFYIGYKWKNSKSIILYGKEVDSLRVLRLEFRLNRAFLKRHDLELSCLEKINNIDLSRLISFKQLNYEKLSKYLQWRHKAQILRLGNDYSGIYIDQLMDCTGFEASVANEIACMKKSRYKNNCQRFLEDMPEANNALFERLRNVKVI